MICKSLRPDTDDVCKYLLIVNTHMGKIRADEDVQEVTIFMKSLSGHNDIQDVGCIIIIRIYYIILYSNL